MLRTFCGLSKSTLIPLSGVVLLSGIILLNSGCGDNNIVADSSVKSGTYYAETGITGDANVVTIERGSRLSKLSILGDGNEVEVEDGVRMPRIEIFGSDNTITVPGDLLVQMNEVGHRNQLIRRPLAKVHEQPQLYETARQNPVDVTIYQQQETLDAQGNVTSSRTFETNYTSPTDPAANPQSSIQELRRISPPPEEPVDNSADKDATPSEPGVVETEYSPLKSTPEDAPAEEEEEDLSPLK